MTLTLASVTPGGQPTPSLRVESRVPKAKHVTQNATRGESSHNFCPLPSDLCLTESVKRRHPRSPGDDQGKPPHEDAATSRTPHFAKAEMRGSRDPAATSAFCLLTSDFKFAKWRHPRSPGDGQGSRHARMPPLRERSPKKAHVRTTEELAAGRRARGRLDRQKDAAPGAARQGPPPPAPERE